MRIIKWILLFYLSIAVGNAQIKRQVVKSVAKSAIKSSVKAEIKSAGKSAAKSAVKREVKAAAKETAKKTAIDAAKSASRNTAKKVAVEAAENTAKKTVEETVAKGAMSSTKKKIGKGVGTATKHASKTSVESGAKKRLSVSVGEQSANKTVEHLAEKEVKTLPKTTFAELAAQRNTRLASSRGQVLKPNSKTVYETAEIARSLPQTSIQKELDQIVVKGKLRMSEKEMEYLLENPKQIRHIIRIKTGDNKNFQEFFVRLAQSDKRQVEKLLGNPEIYAYVSKSIRRSGDGAVHEWLMTKNYKDFLVNPKWGEDGPFLAMSLTKLVQKTENVVF